MENENHSTSTFTSICRENIDLLGVVIKEDQQLIAATANSTVISVGSTYTELLYSDQFQTRTFKRNFKQMCSRS